MMNFRSLFRETSGRLCHRIGLAGFFMLLVLGFSALQAAAQVVTGDIVGTVTDKSSAVLPGAKVTILNTDTSLKRTMQSAATGDYAFSLLPPGMYNVRVEMTGFKAFEIKGLKLGTGDRPRIDAHLDIGNVSDTVEVTGDAVAVLQTDSATVQDVVSEKSVQDLPLNGRNAAAAVQQAAGVNQAAPGSMGQGNRADDRRPGFAYAANGQSDMANNTMVDGLDNNEREQGFAGVRPSVDSIAEIRVLTNNYAAEIGRTAGAVVNIITKAGTNNFHGTAYEYFRNDVFDAKDYFSTGKPEYRQNVFGGSVGGPILKGKTFFFGDVEANRTIQGVVSTSTVPTAYEHTNIGDFSDNGGPVLTSSQINSRGLAYFNLYPTPTNSKFINNYVHQSNKTQYAVSTDDRIDHQFNANNTLFVRFGYNPTDTTIPGSLPDGTIGGKKASLATGPSRTVATNLQANYVHLFNQNLVFELKAGYTRINIQTLPSNMGTDFASAIGFNNSYTKADGLGLPYVWMLAGDYASVGDSIFVPIYDVNNTFQYAAALTWTHANHNVKAGGAVIRRQLNYKQDQWSAAGGFAFLPFASCGYNSMACLLAGTPYAAERGIDLVEQGLRSWEPSLYVQDDWHALPWLTINAGLRWETYTPISEHKNKYANFNMKTLAVEVAGAATSATGGVATDYTDFSPRVGFEANLGHGTIVRGGFGMSYYPPVMQTQVENANPPFNYGCVFCVYGDFLNIPTPDASATVPVGTVSSLPSDLKNAYVRQFNFFVQKQIGGSSISIGGVGEQGRSGLYINNPDLPLPYGQAVDHTTVSKKPYVYATELPNVNNIQRIENHGVTNYYGLQAIFLHPFSHGLMASGNFTWGHGLSNSIQSASSTTNTYATITNNPMYDYGNSPLDVRERIAGNLSYEIPFGKGMTGLMARLVTGWQASLIGFWQTGLPFTVVDSTAAIYLPGITSDRPNQTKSAKRSNPGLNKWFDTSAFATQDYGTVGSEASDSVYGPGSRTINGALLKDFALFGKLGMQFRAEFFNLTNTPNFSNPGNGLTTKQFGIISATAANMTPRQMQFALKLHF